MIYGSSQVCARAKPGKLEPGKTESGTAERAAVWKPGGNINIQFLALPRCAFSRRECVSPHESRDATSFFGATMTGKTVFFFTPIHSRINVFFFWFLAWWLIRITKNCKIKQHQTKPLVVDISLFVVVKMCLCCCLQQTLGLFFGCKYTVCRRGKHLRHGLCFHCVTRSTAVNDLWDGPSSH